MEAIHGVTVTPLKIIKDDRGQVMHMLRSDAPHFKKFGEIYFSVINPGVTKGWKQHTKSTSNMAVPIGKVRFVLVDKRPGSETENQFHEVVLGEQEGEYQLLTVPPNVYYAWQTLGETPSIVANCATEAWSPDESINHPLESIEYPWN